MTVTVNRSQLRLFCLYSKSHGQPCVYVWVVVVVVMDWICLLKIPPWLQCGHRTGKGSDCIGESYYESLQQSRVEVVEDWTRLVVV